MDLSQVQYLADDGSIKKLENDKIQILKNMKYPNSNINILGFNKQITYEILCSLYKIGYTETVKLMNNESVFSNINNENKDRNVYNEINKGIIFGTPLLKESQLRKLTDIEIFKRGDTNEEGVFECPKCKSFNTSTVQKQVRSADEPMSCFNKCNACGYAWRIN